MNNKLLISKDTRETAKQRFYLYLSQTDFDKFSRICKTLGMTKTKVIRLMILEQADIFLINTVEILQRLDMLGIHLSEIRKSLEVIIEQMEKDKYRDLQMGISKESQMLNILQNFQQRENNIEQTLKELLKLLKRMK